MRSGPVRQRRRRAAHAHLTPRAFVAQKPNTSVDTTAPQNLPVSPPGSEADAQAEVAQGQTERRVVVDGGNEGRVCGEVSEPPAGA